MLAWGITSVMILPVLEVIWSAQWALHQEVLRFSLRKDLSWHGATVSTERKLQWEKKQGKHQIHALEMWGNEHKKLWELLGHPEAGQARDRFPARWRELLSPLLLLSFSSSLWFHPALLDLGWWFYLKFSVTFTSLLGLFINPPMILSWGPARILCAISHPGIWIW